MQNKVASRSWSATLGNNRPQWIVWARKFPYLLRNSFLQNQPHRNRNSRPLGHRRFLHYHRVIQYSHRYLNITEGWSCLHCSLTIQSSRSWNAQTSRRPKNPWNYYLRHFCHILGNVEGLIFQIWQNNSKYRVKRYWQKVAGFLREFHHKQSAKAPNLFMNSDPMIPFQWLNSMSQADSGRNRTRDLIIADLSSKST